jgi:hypothetical protein
MVLWYNYLPEANNIKGFDQLRLWYNYFPKANNILGFDQLRLWYHNVSLSKPKMLLAFGK